METQGGAGQGAGWTHLGLDLCGEIKNESSGCGEIVGGMHSREKEQSLLSLCQSSCTGTGTQCL